MLKIKESEWQRFCDNAENLGYKKDKKQYVENSYEQQIKIRESNRKIYIYSTNKPYISTYDKLYDLISQGYVEKVEVEE